MGGLVTWEQYNPATFYIEVSVRSQDSERSYIYVRDMDFACFYFIFDWTLEVLYYDNKIVKPYQSSQSEKFPRKIAI
jgi:hypothetical protein